ncbi:MAG: 4Fe-4S binding protein [Paraclostridium sp.]
MKKMKKKAIIDKEYCVACGSCVKVCPLEIIHIEQGVFAKINEEKCVGCGRCANSCPASVIEIKKIEVGD